MDKSLLLVRRRSDKKTHAGIKVEQETESKAHKAKPLRGYLLKYHVDRASDTKHAE